MWVVMIQVGSLPRIQFLKYVNKEHITCFPTNPAVKQIVCRSMDKDDVCDVLSVHMYISSSLLLLIYYSSISIKCE